MYTWKWLCKGDWEKHNQRKWCKSRVLEAMCRVCFQKRVLNHVQCSLYFKQDLDWTLTARFNKWKYLLRTIFGHGCGYKNLIISFYSNTKRKEIHIISLDNVVIGWVSKVSEVHILDSISWWSWWLYLCFHLVKTDLVPCFWFMYLYIFVLLH